MENLTTIISELQTVNNEIDLKISNLNSQLLASDARVSTLNSLLSTSEANVKLLQTQLATSDAKVSTLTSQLATSEAKVKSLQAELDAIKTTTTTTTTTIPPTTTTTTTIPPNAIYFKGTTDNVSIVNNDLIGWTIPVASRNPYFNNLGGNAYAFEDVRVDPNGSGKKVIYLQTIEDDPSAGGTTRAQMSINIGQNLEIIHTQQRMMFHPDVQYLENYSSGIGWFTIYELWNKRDSTMGGDPAGSARWNLALYKDSGIGKPLYWQIEAEKMQPSTQNWMWKASNRTVPVPYGKWFTLDFYLKRGEGSLGQLMISITVDGVTTTICNVSNSTLYPTKPELYPSAVSPFKIYLNSTTLTWMKSQGKKLAAYYSDFTWFKS